MELSGIHIGSRRMSENSVRWKQRQRYRNDIAKRIFDKVDSEPLVSIDDIVGPRGLRTRRYCGLYFLYNTSKKIIYIGQLKYGGKSDLRQRLLQHRRKRYWFKEVKFVRFHKFSSIGESKLDIAERLVIMFTGQPIYNDKDTSYERLNAFNWENMMLS